MAEEEKKKKEKTVYSGNPHDPSSYADYPEKPSTWDAVKESFLPTTERIMLEQVRKRRAAAGS